jgi:hypothetical protein
LNKEILAPGVVLYKNVFSNYLEFIERYEKSLSGNHYSWNDAETETTDAYSFSSRICKDFRYTKKAITQNNDDALDLIKLYDEIVDPIKKCLLDYEEMFYIKVNFFEALNIIKYNSGNFFNYHSDDGEVARYTVSCVGYLNDDYEGGELHFKFFDLLYKPNAGDLLLFPSSYIYAHAAYPVRSGTKYSLVLMTDRNNEGHKEYIPHKINGDI